MDIVKAIHISSKDIIKIIYKVTGDDLDKSTEREKEKEKQK